MSLTARRVELSLPLEPGCLSEPERVVPVFHGVIRDRSLPGVWVDVARYAHVGHGPVVILVGHEADYAIEREAAGVRLARTRKRGSDSLLDRELLAGLLQMAEILESSLAGVRVRTDEFRLRVLDRLRVPNTPEVVMVARSQVHGLAVALVGSAEVAALDDEGEPVTLRVSRSRNQSVSEARRALAC